MFDTDKFIQTIEENPPIWEKGTKEYSDRGAKEKCWFNVGAGMFENWEEMTDADKQSQLKDLKNKWRHIRDNFAKYINQGKSGDPAGKRKKYVYADALSFLLQSMSTRRTSGNFEFETERQEEDDEKENPEIEGTSETDQPPPEAVKKRRGKTAEMTVFQQKLLQKLEHSDSVADDPDKAFMLSLLPDVKKLDDDEKLDFRYHVLQFFRDRRNKRNPTHSIAQPSTSFYPQPPTASYLQPPTPSYQQYSTFRPQHQIPYQQIHLNTSQSSILVHPTVSSPSPGSSVSSPAEHIHYSDSSNFTDL